MSEDLLEQIIELNSFEEILLRDNNVDLFPKGKITNSLKGALIVTNNRTRAHLASKW